MLRNLGYKTTPFSSWGLKIPHFCRMRVKTKIVEKALSEPERETIRDRATVESDEILGQINRSLNKLQIYHFKPMNDN